MINNQKFDSPSGQKKTLSAKRADSVVGYAWLPLLGRGGQRVGGVSRGEHQLKVAVKLPEGGGYLSQPSHYSLQQLQQRGGGSTSALNGAPGSGLSSHPSLTALTGRGGSGRGAGNFTPNKAGAPHQPGTMMSSSATLPSVAPAMNGTGHSAGAAGNNHGNDEDADMKGVFYSFTEAFDKPEKLSSTPISWVDPAKPLFRVSITWDSTVYR